MEAFVTEFAPHFVGGLQRELAFLLPREPNGFKERRILDLPAGRTADSYLGKRSDEISQVVFDEMFFQLITGGERFRFGVEKAFVFGLEAQRIDPGLDRLRIAHGLNSRFELLKMHMPQPLLVMADEATLVLMVIGRPQPHTGNPAAIYKSEIAFWWINGRLLFFEDHLSMLAQCESHRLILPQKQAFTRVHEKQWLRRAVRSGFMGKFYQMPLGFIENELGDIEQGVGPLVLLHRLEHCGESFFLGLERDVDWQRGRSRGHGSAVLSWSITSLRRPAAALFGTSTTTVAGFRWPLWTRALVAVGAATVVTVRAPALPTGFTVSAGMIGVGFAG